MFSKWNIFVLTLVAFFNLLLKTGIAASAPVQPTSAYDDKYPVMVAVSSTVIPLQLFGKPKPLQGGRATARPRSHTAASSYLTPARRMRLLERSRRPDEPVRLITKNSKQKDLNNETY